MISFTKKINNETFIFERTQNQDGKQCYYIKCSKLGKPFFMIPKKGSWEFEYPDSVFEDFLKLQKELSDTIKKNDRTPAAKS